MDQQQWLTTLNMLPISETMFANKFEHFANEPNINWILFDVYKIAPNYPLEISTYGYIFKEPTINYTNNFTNDSTQRLQITTKFLSKSTRDDLKGLQLKCGLVVGIFTYFILINILVACLTNCVYNRLHIRRDTHILRIQKLKMWIYLRKEQLALQQICAKI